MAAKHWTALIVLMLFVSIQVLKTSGQETQERKCATSTDCNEDECCVLDFIQLEVPHRIPEIHAVQVCRKLRNLDESCELMSNYLQQNELARVQCPCKNGLKCDIPDLDIQLDFGGQLIQKFELPVPKCVEG